MFNEIYGEMNTIYSAHNFIFVFRWDFLRKGKKFDDVEFDRRTDLEKINELLKQNNWDRKNNITHHYFNYFTYFYEFVRETVYDSNDKNSIVRYYEYKIDGIDADKKKYVIEYLDGFNNDDFKVLTTEGECTNYIINKTKKIILNVKGITLFIFGTGVGAISFDLQNTLPEQSKPEDILKINEFGRRIYPQFLNFDERNYIFNAQRVFLSRSITLFYWNEDFEWYNKSENFKSNKPIVLPLFIKKLFDGIPLDGENSEDVKNDRLRLKYVTDDRMFFVSWYGNDRFSSVIGRTYSKSNWWYAYIFGDKENPTIANNEMKNEQIRLHTYQRWSGYGTLYGMSRDSFVCLSASENFMNENDLPNLRKHQNSIYYQIAVLCLVQRASVLKFSAEVTQISDIYKKGETEISSKIENIYAHYIKFLNKMYFREVTSQIQGIEIYKKFQEIMNIHNDVKDLDKQINELSSFAHLLEQKRENDEMKTHTLLATIFLPAMLISGILGMNVWEQFHTTIPKYFFGGNFVWSFWIPVLIFTIPILLFTKSHRIIIKFFKKIKNKKYGVG